MAIGQLINCGCSFAHGYNGEDLTDSQYKVIKFPGLPYLKRSGYKSVGYYLAESKNLDYIDLSRNGNSNETIFRTLQYYLDNYDCKNSIVCIGWTHAFRREYLGWNVKDKKTEWIQYREVPKRNSYFSKLADKIIGPKMSPTMVEFNERNFRPLAYADHIEYRQYNLMLMTQIILESKNIPYVMYNGCGNEHDSKSKDVINLKNKINKQRFLKFTGPSFDKYVLDNPEFISVDAGHPNVKGHKKWAEMIKPIFEEVFKSYV